MLEYIIPIVGLVVIALVCIKVVPKDHKPSG